MHVEKCAKNQAYINDLNANPADITSVYEAFCDCDPSKLLDAVLNIEIGQKARVAFPKAKKDMLLCRLKADLEVMRNLAPCDSGSVEVLAPSQYFETLHNMPWPKALSMHVWLPESLNEQERYFILGQIFSALTCDFLTQISPNAA